MDVRKEPVEVDGMDIGLDRARITDDKQIQLPRLDDEDSSHSDQFDHESRSSSSLVNTLKQRKHHAAVKIRKTLHLSKPSDDLDSPSPVLANTADEQSDSRLVHQLPVPDKANVKDFLRHPIDTVTSKVSDQGNQQVAANIAAKEVSHGEEVDLINAHDAVGRARTEHEKLLALNDVKKLMKARQSTYARWSLDRHVTKIRVLPRETMVRKPKTAFQKKDPRGQIVTDWNAYANHLLVFYAHQYGGQYIGYGSDPPTPSKETIMPNIERLIVATSPFQEFIMTTRRVYRWESRAETTKYLVIYLVLWYFNLLLPGILSAVLYLVLERHFHGNTLEDLREDIKHREDTTQTALSLNEFIEKRGDEKWADEIVQVVGPWLMIQLGDMANFFETLRNFYEWRKPTRTATTLGVLAVVIIACALTPTWFLVKSSTLSAGFVFFALFPLGTNFPQYRLLVSPTRCMLWNIPTHQEWAIKYIQAEGLRVAATSHPKPTAIPIRTSPESMQVDDYGFYTAHHDKAAGHLIISASSCRFVSNLSHKEHFHIRYDQIHKLEKQDRILSKKLPNMVQSDEGRDLMLVLEGGREILLVDLGKRDEAFAQIVGLSLSTWQIVW